MRVTVLVLSITIVALGVWEQVLTQEKIHFMKNKKKNKAEYLRKKKLKTEAKRKEAEHDINYSEYNPTRDNSTPHRSILDGMGGLDPMTVIALMGPMLRRKRPMGITNVEKPRNKE